MIKNELFRRNISALSKRNPALASGLSALHITRGSYKFMKAAGGEVVPALQDSSGALHSLHSMMDPKKEARRLIATVESEAFLILLGLGGAYYAEAALDREDISTVLVVEYDLSALAELLCGVDYVRVFEDPRFHIFADPPDEILQARIPELYRPVLSGGIRVIPLRPRTGSDPRFAAAGTAIESAIKRVSADYSVQVHFGKRWFSNIIRNLESARVIEAALPKVQRAGICAAGPSLTAQIPSLRKKRKELFLIATDTSLPCLLHAELMPDAVISIDCQHISYYHFMSGLPKGIPLFLDLASPPLLAGFSGESRFFTGAHPLARYISRTWMAMPELDLSGGNVTYAALSLAETLGAAEAELYGADFSYPCGVSYARGTYIYSLFGKRQNRLSPLEAQSSAFLYRTDLEKKSSGSSSWYYETATLKFYRERLEEKALGMNALVVPVRGAGAPIEIRRGAKKGEARSHTLFGKPVSGSCDFLRSYRDKLSKLPEAGKNAAEYFALLDGEERGVFTTILPAASAVKQRLTESRLSKENSPQPSFRELIEETKAFCVKEIDRVLCSRF